MNNGLPLYARQRHKPNFMRVTDGPGTDRTLVLDMASEQSLELDVRKLSGDMNFDDDPAQRGLVDEE
jgi:hypothetical protein